VSGTYTTCTKESLTYYYDNMSPQELSHVTSFLAPKSSEFPLDGNLFSLEIFAVDIRPVFQVIAKILGKEDSNQVDKVVLGFLSLMMNPEIVLDILEFWVDAINIQFMPLPLPCSFKFPSAITYLFLYQNVERFSNLGLNVVNINKKKQSMVFSTGLIRGDLEDSGLFEFTSLFLPVAYKILNGSLPPTFLPKSQECLQLSKDVRCGDWFIFEEHAEIRLYGASVKAYRLP